MLEGELRSIHAQVLWSGAQPAQVKLWTGHVGPTMFRPCLESAHFFYPAARASHSYHHSTPVKSFHRPAKCLLKLSKTLTDPVVKQLTSPVFAKTAYPTTHTSRCSRRITAPSVKYVRGRSRSFAGKPTALRVRREQTYALPVRVSRIAVSAVCWICHSACPSLSGMRR